MTTWGGGTGDAIGLAVGAGCATGCGAGAAGGGNVATGATAGRTMVFDGAETGGWIGGGNTGRNTTIVRSNYLWDESTHLYEKSMKLWEGLSQDLNYNVMFSQRGVLNLAPVDFSDWNGDGRPAKTPVALCSTVEVLP